jgi:hypothetical protein
MAEATRQGKGTFGRLMSDEELYEELIFAVKDAREAIAATKETVDFFREHPDAILKGKPKEKATSK